MKFVVYVSQAKKPFQSNELSLLLEHSRIRNSKDKITGLLIYRFNSEFSRGNFVQILEGPEAAIDDVWQRISSDSRHHTIITLEAGKAEDRMFSDWSMGFRNVDADDLKGFEGFSDLGSDNFWNQANLSAKTDALELLKSFYDGA
ncbi:MAG: BLUF domain-containing protein [Salaquimonas sp.]